jgi:hypothetical protein
MDKRPVFHEWLVSTEKRMEAKTHNFSAIQQLHSAQEHTKKTLKNISNVPAAT